MGIPQGQSPYFLYVGRLEKLKGLQTIIPIFRQQNQAQLVITGEGTYERVLRRIAGGVSRVQFLGHVSKARLAGLYRGAVALILPSLTFEMFPLVLVESFKEKTPVIVRNLGGMPEIARDSGGGLVYNDDDEFKAVMDRLCTDRAFRDDLGERGYLTYCQRWTPDAHLERYFQIIHELSR